MINPIYLKIIIFREFREFWLKKTKNWFKEIFKTTWSTKINKVKSSKIFIFYVDRKLFKNFDNKISIIFLLKLI